MTIATTDFVDIDNRHSVYTECLLRVNIKFEFPQYLNLNLGLQAIREANGLAKY